MFYAVLSAIMVSLHIVGCRPMLTCHASPSTSCSARVAINCTCMVFGQLTWIVESPPAVTGRSARYYRITYSETNQNPTPQLGAMVDRDDYTPVLLSINENTSPPTFSSALRFTQLQDVNVHCRGDVFVGDILLKIAGSSSVFT